MEDGKEFSLKPATGLSPDLFISDPFTGTKTISIRAMGDLDKDIDTIFGDFKYVDETNVYSKTTSIALSKANPFFDSSTVNPPIPGKVFYSGNIRFKNGQVEPIPRLGHLQRHHPDRQEGRRHARSQGARETSWTSVRCHWPSCGSNMRTRPTRLASRPTTFSSRAATPAKWSVELKDKKKRNYKWRVEYFLRNSRKSTDWAEPRADPSG